MNGQQPFGFARLALFVTLLVTIRPANGDDAKQLDFFEARIRPMLVKHCYECHSAGASEVKGGLLVDSAVGLLKGGDSGPALVKHKPDASALIAALRYDGQEMPPDGKLPEAVIRDFERWVEMGAPDPRITVTEEPVRQAIDIEKGRQFWAFQPPKRHAAPRTQNSSWPRTGIDAFILSRLESANLKPVADADRGTLVRRLYFDLIGLPPTPTELSAAMRDTSPGAIDTLVNRLLDSPQFGAAIWGRHWLDVARYADSNGGDFNATFHNAWRYRDYVVDSMNNNKQFDQFVREQIAGDLLPFDSDAQRAEQVIATGFLMLGTKMLSERDKDKLQMDVVDEQISTVGSAFLGMTLGCARCHDHKFDPIPTRDYYALAGIFRSSRTLHGESQKYVSTWKRSDLPADPRKIEAVRQHDAQTKVLSKQLAQAKKQLTAAENRLKNRVAMDNPLLVDDVAAKRVGSWQPSTSTPRFIGKGYLHDDRQGKGTKSITFSMAVTKAAEYDVRLSYTHSSGRANNVPIMIQHASGETELSLDQTREPSINGLFASVGRFRFEPQKPATIMISTKGTTGHVIADAVQLVELNADGQPANVVSAADREAKQKLQQQVDDAKTLVVSMQSQVDQLGKTAPPPLPQAIAIAEFDEIDDCEICVRGEHRNRGAKVPRGFLQVALTSAGPEIAKERSGRGELADWIASPEHPLTGRVIVNRVWYHLLGEGIVRSVDNFGELGRRPSHPELLDDLASRFVASSGTGGFNWSLKQLIREIVLSRTYQLSSDHDEAAWSIDSENQLLWRAHRRRLPAEAIRDTMLAVSGALDLSPGGSPVEGLGTLVTTNSADADAYESKQTTRRSLYLPIIRNELPAALAVFDFADPDLVVGKRPVTNVPAQALLLMNSPFVMESALRTAEQLLRNTSQTTRQLVTNAYLVILSRAPDEDEVNQAIAYLHDAEATTNSPGEPELPNVTRLSRFIHILFATTEFRMLS